MRSCPGQTSSRESAEMKRVITVLLLLIGAVLVGVWWWVRQSPEQVTRLLVEGGLEVGQAEDLVDLFDRQAQDEESDVLVVSGAVEGEAVSIVSEFGGLVVGLYADEGDEVEAGQMLVKLDDSVLRAQIAQAEAVVRVAESNLAVVQAGAHPAEVLAAEARLRQAVAERDAARTSWEDLKAILDSPQGICVRLAEAQTKAELAAVQIEQAEAELASAIVERDRYQAQGSLEEKKLYTIHSYRVEAAQAAVDGAKANEAGAMEVVAALRALRDNPLALASQVHGAETQFKIAAAGVGVAAAKLDELKAEALPEAIAVAEAQVARAQAACAVFQAQIDKMTLFSPIDGVVASRSVHTGEAAVAGVTLLTVAGLDEVTLTLYVPVDELNRVYLGQGVDVRVDSFPDRVFAGTVSYISQQAEFTPRNVQTQEARANMVFAVKVRLSNSERLLKPGMPADVVISR
jgi:HlyD family secretion protein